MIWKKLVQSYFKRRTEGFTFIEVIVSITVLMIIGFSLWASFNSAVMVSLKIPGLSRDISDLVMLDGFVRGAINQVKPPFWIGELELDLKAEPVVIPYYNGYKDNTITFEFRDKLLTVTIEETSLPELPINSPAPAVDPANSPPAASPAPAPAPAPVAQVKLDDLKPVKTSTVFGPFEGFAPPEELLDDNDMPIGLLLTIITGPDPSDKVEIAARFGTECFWIKP
jgi:hypothetical protein